MSMEIVPPYTKSPVHDPGGTMMDIAVPNKRRTPSMDVRELAGGQKRRRLSQSPRNSNVPGVLSQESQSSDQSASKWFDDANKNMLSRNRVRSKVDDDPPFYMSNRTAYVPPSFGAAESDRMFGNQSRFDSENEDLRGVIDDLTVENKRLRQMVRSHNRNRRGTPSDISQQQDKLFEVRMHGLPPEKRRELEFLLKNFATSVHTTNPSKASSAHTSLSATSSNGQVAGGLKAPLTDSGYASMSNSGQGSGLYLASQPPARSANKNVKSYLHEIPNSLLPRQNPIMSERAKMALVVRRLEQLFTGRKAAPGEHSQPVQQQEVSNSAAKADQIRDAGNNMKRKVEGSREAHVMPPDSKINLDAIDGPEPKHQRLMAKLEPDVAGSDISMPSQPGSPDQRPTRPLDLDIHRAQVASENIQYIRHLGLSVAQPNPGAEDAENQWLYLNLLSGMAQLHTLNVTPEFVRRAIKKFSKNFELSRDCQRVRWIGGSEGTKFTAEDEKVLEAAETSPPELAEDVASGGSSSKRSKSNSTSNPAITSNDTPSEDKTSGLQTSSDSKVQQNTVSGNSNLQSSNMQSSTNMTKPTTVGSAFDYKPVVFKEGLREEYAENYLRDSDESYDSTSGDSSGLAQALSRSNLNQQSREEGPITFYNNPHFCSDFSADNTPSNMRDARPVMIGETLGISIPDEGAESPLRYHDATYFAMQFAPKPYQPQGDHDPKLQINVPNLEPLVYAGEEETYPLEMEVCGLGGVVPDDNFAVDVKTRLVRVPAGRGHRLIRQLPFSGRKYAQRYRYDLDEERNIKLVPSKLPPPSYVFFTSSSSSNTIDEDDASEDSNESSSVDEDFEPPPPAFLMEFSNSSGGGIADDEDEHESSSIDMLAMARRANPREIAEQERVYLINQPGEFGRTVAGSLAATVGESRSPSPAQEEGISSDASDNGSMDAEMDD